MKTIKLIILFLFVVLSSSAQWKQTHRWKAVEVGGGGFVTGFCFSQTERNLIYARTDVGGAYLWKEEDKSWERITDCLTAQEWTLAGILGICLDPGRPGRVFMMGGSYINPPSCILRSDDYGKTFKRFVVPFQINGTGSPNGERLTLDPNNPTILYCATQKSGLWKSINSGETWFQVTSFQKAVTGSFEGNLGLSFVLFDPSSSISGTPSKRIIVGVNRLDNNNVYLTEDGGATWQPIVGFPTSSKPQRVHLQDDLMYVTFNKADSPAGGNDGGFYSYSLYQKKVVNLSPPGLKCGYSGLAVDRNMPGHIILITSGAGYQWPALNGSWADYIWRTRDGGKTWDAIMKANQIKMNYQGYDYAAGVAPHWMANIMFDPFDSNRFFFSSGNGIYRCDNLLDYDQGKQIEFKFTTKGLNETVVFDFVAPTTGAEMVCAIGDYSGFRNEKLDNPGKRFTPAGGANNYSIDVAAGNANSMARTTSNPDFGAMYSIDNGITWRKLGKYAIPDSVYAGKIAVSCDGTTYVWAPKNKPVRMSFTRGSSWNMCEGDVPYNLDPIADNVNPEKFYMFDGYRLYYSYDGGFEFKNISVAQLGIATHSEYGCVRAFPSREGELWLPLRDRGLYILKMGNDKPVAKRMANVKSCRAVGFGAPKPGSGQPVSVYIYGYVKDNYFEGVYRSDDMGETWIQVNDLQHQFFGIGNGVLSGDPNVYGRVYMTSGGGMGVLYGEPVDEIQYIDAKLPARIIKVGKSQACTTIEQAYNQIDNTFTESTLIELQEDYEPTEEQYPIVLTNKETSSASNFICIRPAVGVNKKMESAQCIFSFDGAKYVTIDGRAGGQGEMALELYCSNTEAGSKMVQFINDAQHNSLKYCRVLGSGRSSSSGTIWIGKTDKNENRYGTNGDFGGSGNLHNEITRCHIGNGEAGFPANAIYLNGTDTYTNEGTVISYNNIYNFSTSFSGAVCSGVHNGDNSNTTEIIGNKFYQTDISNIQNSALIYPIYINTSGMVSRIDDNQIGRTAECDKWTTIATGEARFAGIMIEKIKGGTSIKVDGNKISGIDLTSTSPGNAVSGVMAGIVCRAGNWGASPDVYENEISDLTLRFGSTLTGSPGLCGFIYNNGGGSVALNAMTIKNLNAVPLDNSSSVVGKIVGVSIQNAYGASCQNTTIGQLTCGAEYSDENRHQVYGIYTYTSNNRPNLVARNFVYNLSSKSSLGTVTAIASGAGTGSLTLRNNIVALGNGLVKGCALRGILVDNSGNDDIYHNSVYIGGSVQEKTANTYAFACQLTARPDGRVKKIKNNIFVNKRKGGSVGKHYAVSILYPSGETEFASLSSDHNIYQLNGTDNGEWGQVMGVDCTLTSWQNRTGNDRNSKCVDPGFVDPDNEELPNLSIASEKTEVDAQGDLSLTCIDDFYGRVRTSLTPCDIGAFAYIQGEASRVHNEKQNRIKIKNYRGGIVVEGAKDRYMFIFTLDGCLFKSTQITENEHITELAQGVYIIQFEDERFKIIVY